MRKFLADKAAMVRVRRQAVMCAVVLLVGTLCAYGRLDAAQTQRALPYSVQWELTKRDPSGGGSAGGALAASGGRLLYVRP